MLPKKTPSQKSGKSLRTGSLVLFDHEDTVRLATVLGFARLKARILSELKTEHELTFSRLTLLPGELPKKLHDADEISAHLVKLRKEAEKDSANIDLAKLWETTAAEREYTCEELCEQVDSDLSPLKSYLAVRYALQLHPEYYKRRKQTFLPRTPEELEQFKVSLAEKDKKMKQLERGLENLRQRVDNPELPLTDEATELIALITKVASGASHLTNQEKKDSKQIIDSFADSLRISLGGNREERSFKFLQRVHCIHKNFNLALHRHDFPLQFTKEAVEHAEQLLSDTTQTPDYYNDRSKLHTLTIDDASTRDMDDALSFRRTDDGYELGIHISDVASAVERGSAVDHDARDRATSLYLPEGNHNMLPAQLSEDKLSLRQGEKRKCISCFYDIGADFTIQSSSVELAEVVVDERFSYNQVDELLESGNDLILQNIYNIAMTLEADRLGGGGMKIPKREVEIIVEDRENLAKSDFHLRDLDENGPARSLIGEMMILANTTLAQYAHDNSIPFIYRSQEASEPSNNHPDENLPGPASDYLMKSKLKRSVTSTQPGSHATLGLAIYTQATSPIRRYSDLCNQRQIVAALSGLETPYTKEGLEEIISETSQSAARARLITRETHRAWVLRYLQRKRENKDTIDATVLKDDKRHYLVELEEIYIPALLKSQKKLRVGDEISARIKTIDPRYDILRLEY